MRVLVACEFSGVVRDAFIAKGHDAWSCDLLDTEKPGPHIKDDVLRHLGDGWDLMIAHPPCTHLAVSGARWFKDKIHEQNLAVDFFIALADCGIHRIAVENPIGIMSTIYRKPDQIIQPWQFGHPESKATCLWLKNFPLLRATNIIEKPARGYWDNQTLSGQNRLAPSVDRWKLRSVTYAGIAAAMAAQWGGV